MDIVQEYVDGVKEFGVGLLTAHFKKWKFNPHIDEWADLREMCLMVMALCGLRFFLAGAYHKRLSKIPCLFQLITRNFSDERRRNKFHENLWYACWHTCSFTLTIKTLSTQPWSRPLFFDFNATVMFLGWVDHAWPAEVGFWYKLETAFWVSCMVFLMVETVRKDFWQMLFHHVITVWLLWCSYLYNFHRVGIAVLLLHDIGDIFLYTAKSFNYLKSKWLTWLADPFFGLFVIAFFFFRLFAYPVLLVVPSLKCALDLDPNYADKELMRISQGVGMMMFPCLLCLLWLVQVLWAVMILKMIWRMVTKKQSVNEGGDVRSDDESSDDETAKNAKKKKKN